MKPNTESAGPTDISMLADMLFTGTWSVLSTTVADGRVSYVVGRTNRAPKRGTGLSRCERAVIVMAFHGHANKQIAATLSLSLSSVSTLLRRARHKLNGRVPLHLLGALCRELPQAPQAATFAASGPDRASERAG